MYEHTHLYPPFFILWTNLSLSPMFPVTNVCVRQQQSRERENNRSALTALLHVVSLLSLSPLAQGHCLLLVAFAIITRCFRRRPFVVRTDSIPTTNDNNNNIVGNEKTRRAESGNNSSSLSLSSTAA